MKVSVTAKIIYDDKLGKLVKGQEIEMPTHKAEFYLQRGDVEFYQTKVIRDRPLPIAGEQSFVAPVAQALPVTTSSKSGYGVKKKAKTKASS
jgi:hypothetical protein